MYICVLYVVKIHFSLPDRTPEYTIIREPLEGEIPEFLVMEIKLPGIVSTCMYNVMWVYAAIVTWGEG